MEVEDAFDLEAYAATYNGHAKIDRLIFIADKIQGTARELEALKMAAAELKKTEMTAKYLEVSNKLQARAGLNFAPDMDWVDAVDRRALQRQERLETELNGYKTNLVKESIRMGHNDLGDFFYHRGDLSNAFKNYMRTRDYSTTSRHIIHMCLSVVKCSIEMGNYVHVPTYVQKAESTPDGQSDTLVRSKLACASGLYLLESGKYLQAARKFTEVSPELGSQYNEVISAHDVAVYGALCAMASFDRSQLRASVIDSPNFREFLELVPEVREALNDFYGSRYTDCLPRLERLRSQLALDIHLHDHVDKLYQAVRNRALTQYVAPFATLDLNSMAQAFNTSVGGIQSELAALIGQKEVSARIDSHRQVLYARRSDQRSTTFRQALQAGEEYLRSSKALLLRASIMKHDLIQKPSGGGGGGGPDQPGGRPDGPTGRHGRQREHRTERGEGRSGRAGFLGMGAITERLGMGGGGGESGADTPF
ncbi:hypothetical protein N2152v2_001547 [Parachlorella kessleri]